MKNKTFTLLLAGALAVLPVAAAYADTAVTAANESDGTDTSSGDATASNSGSAQVGHQGGGRSDVGSSDVESADIEQSDAVNVQEGDNDLDVTQDANSASGDTVGGQVIGGVVSGNLDVDATNLSENVDAVSGDADSTNDFAAFVGLSNASDTSIGASDISDAAGINIQDGDNDSSIVQGTDAVTGDAVGGQVFGATVSGTTDAVLSNTSDDATVESGDADEASDTDAFTGLLARGTLAI